MDRRPFAQYTRESGDEVLDVPPLPREKLEEYWFERTRVILVREIMSEGKAIGFVYLRADLREIDQRLKRYATIAFSVLARGHAGLILLP